MDSETPALWDLGRLSEVNTLLLFIMAVLKSMVHMSVRLWSLEKNIFPGCVPGRFRHLDSHGEEALQEGILCPQEGLLPDTQNSKMTEGGQQALPHIPVPHLPTAKPITAALLLISQC